VNSKGGLESDLLEVKGGVGSFVFHILSIGQNAVFRKGANRTFGYGLPYLSESRGPLANNRRSNRRLGEPKGARSRAGRRQGARAAPQARHLAGRSRRGPRSRARGLPAGGRGGIEVTFS